MALLNPEQADLFLRLQMSEKVHAMVMIRKLVAQGENQPDLLVAALLHDVGKLRYHLNPLERAMVVLVKAFKPALAHQWGKLPPNGWEGISGWRKAFIVAEQHAAWGAEMARKTGVSRLTEALIRSHQHENTSDLDDIENILLNKLWVADNES